MLVELEETIRDLALHGGPRKSDYRTLSETIQKTHQAVSIGLIHQSDVYSVLNQFGDVFSTATLQGLALRKPHGYAGDFEMMEKIYSMHIAQDMHLANWDRYFHAQRAPQAVRNRKAYFHRLLDGLLPGPARVLNLGVGPGRCMHEWFARNIDANLSIA